MKEAIVGQSDPLREHSEDTQRLIKGNHVRVHTSTAIKGNHVHVHTSTAINGNHVRVHTSTVSPPKW